MKAETNSQQLIRNNYQTGNDADIVNIQDTILKNIKNNNEITRAICRETRLEFPLEKSLRENERILSKTISNDR